LNTRALIREERDYLVTNLKALGMTVIAANANYIFIRDPRSEKACPAGGKEGEKNPRRPEETPLHESLFHRGILIRNCDNYVGLGPGYYRICIRKREDNAKLIEAIKEIQSAGSGAEPADLKDSVGQAGLKDSAGQAGLKDGAGQEG